MNQITNILNAALPYVVLTAVGIVAIYPYAKQHNPAIADKIKWLYDVAQYIVTQQATHDDKTGTAKKIDATNALLEQAKKSKTKITPETAKGMIEKAYQDLQKDVEPDIDDVQGFVDDDEDEQSIGNQMANKPTDNIETDGTDSNDDTAN